MCSFEEVPLVGMRVLNNEIFSDDHCLAKILSGETPTEVNPTELNPIELNPIELNPAVESHPVRRPIPADKRIQASTTAPITCVGIV